MEITRNEHKHKQFLHCNHNLIFIHNDMLIQSRLCFECFGLSSKLYLLLLLTLFQPDLLSEYELAAYSLLV